MVQKHKLPLLNLPDIQVRLETLDGKNYIYDALRRKNVICTPEEWVRQHFVHFLITHKSYPRGLISIEKGLSYNKMEKRSDILIYDREGKVFMLIECKAPNIKIKKETFYQASLYNKTYNARYIVLTNGLQHYCCFMDYESGQINNLPDIPSFED